MPTNVTHEYKAAEATYKAAKELPERIVALQEMLRVIPKHKGTDHLCGQLKKKLSQLKDEQRAGPKKTGRRADPGHVPPQGAGQVVLLGPPNGGKSALLAAMTNAEPDVGAWPFTTRKPLPGMAKFEDAPIQLVDAPATEHGGWQPWMSSLLRNADLGLLVVDPGAVGVLDALETAQGLVGTSKLELIPAWWAVRDVEEAEEEDVADDMELSDEELLARLEPGRAELPVLIVGNKLDLPGREDDFEVLTEFLGEDWPMLAVSAEAGRGLEQLAAAMWRGLKMIRVYSKPPGKPPSMAEPILLPLGSTVRDMARLIHKELASRLTFARIWGQGYHDGQKIPRDHVLADRDVVEMHT